MNKKLLAFLCLASVPAWCSYQPITGSTVTVVQPTGTSLQTTANPSGTYTVTPGTGTFQTNNAATLNTVSTNTIVLQAVQLASGTVTNPFVVTVPLAVQLASGTATNPFNITGSISNTSFNTPNVGVFIDSSPYTQASSSEAPVGGVYLQVLTPFVSSTTAAFRMNQYRALYVLLSDANGVILGTSTTNAIQVTAAQGTPPWSFAQSGTYTITPGSGTLQTSNAATLNTVSTNTSVLQAVFLASGTTTNPLQVNNAATLNVVSTYTVVTSTHGDNDIQAGNDRQTGLVATYQEPFATAAGTAGRNATLEVGLDRLLHAAVLPSINGDAYSASTGTINPASNATYIAGLCGNASNMVLLYHLRVSCTQTTAGIVPITIFKSTQTFVGAFSTMTATQDDTNYEGAISSAVWFQANPTIASSGGGGLNGNLDTYRLGCMATGTATPNDIYFSPSDWRMKPQVLRGTNQCISVSLNGTTVTGGLFDVTFEWMEVPTQSP